MKHSMNIDRSKLVCLWYEDEKGNQYIPTDDEMENPDTMFPEGYQYMVSAFPSVLRTTYYDMDSNQELMVGESSYPEDLVLAMANSGDWTLSEAIRIAADCCGRCMNSLAYDYGLDWGYPEYSGDWQKCGTSCEFCEEEEEWYGAGYGDD